MESYVSIPFLLVLIIVVIEACWGVYSFHYIANVSHAAARYAIVRGADWSTNCDGSGSAGSGYGSAQCTASTADIANYVANRDYPGIHIPASDVCVEYFSSVPASATQNCITSTGSTLANSAGDIVQVTVTYPITVTWPSWPLWKRNTSTWNLMSTSQMIIAQ